MFTLSNQPLQKSERASLAKKRLRFDFRSGAGVALTAAALLWGAGQAKADFFDYYWSPAIAVSTTNTSWSASGKIGGYTFTNFVRDPDFDIIGQYGKNPNGNLNYETPILGSGTNLIYGSYLPPSYEFFEYYSSYNPYANAALHSIAFNGDAAAQGFSLTGKSLTFLYQNGLGGSISVNNDFVNTVANDISLNSLLFLNGMGTGSLRLTGALTGASGLNLSGTTTTLTRQASYKGSTFIGNGGVLQGGASNAFSPFSAYTLFSNATLDLNGYDQAIGTLSGNGGILTNNGAANATLLINGYVTQSSFNGVIADGVNGGKLALTIRPKGPATYQLRLGAATNSGTTRIENGAELIGASVNSLSPHSTYDVRGQLTLNGTSQIIGGLTGNGRVTNSDASNVGAATLSVGANNQDTTFSGVITNGTQGGALSLYKQGSGTLSLSGANSSTGGTTIAGGGVRINNADALGSGILTLDGGALAIGVSLENASFGAVFLGANGGEINTSNNSFTLNQLVYGPGSLTKTGNGLLKMTSANIYSGDTLINAGTLSVNNAAGSGTGTGNVYIASGATLAGTGSVAGDVFVATGGTISPGNSPGTLSLLGNLTMGTGGILLIQIGGTNAGEFDQLLVHGAAQLSSSIVKIEFLSGFYARPGDSFDFFSVDGPVSGNFALISPPGFQGNVIQQRGSDGVTRFLLRPASPQGLPPAAPEPASAALLLLGAFSTTRGVLIRRR